MRAMGKNIGFLLIALAIVFEGSTYTMAQSVDKSPASDSAFMMGHATIKLIDENGDVKAYRQTDNQLVEEGFAAVCNLLFTGVTGCANAQGAMSHMGIGTSGAATASDQVDVQTDIGACARVAFDSAVGVVSSISNVAQVVVTVKTTFQGSDGCIGDVTEAVVANSATKNTEQILGRNTFTAVTVGASDSLEVTWAFTYKDS